MRSQPAVIKYPDRRARLSVFSGVNPPNFADLPGPGSAGEEWVNLHSARLRGRDCRIEVWARCVPEVLACGGGWIVDHTRAGWSVSVVLPTDNDVRDVDAAALRVLAAQLICADDAKHLPSAIAVPAAAYEDEDALRDRVSSRACYCGVDALYLLGPTATSTPGLVGLHCDIHALTPAGRAFKRAALTSRGLPVQPTDTREQIHVLAIPPRGHGRLG